jgi:hypothetical protein
MQSSKWPLFSYRKLLVEISGAPPAVVYFFPYRAPKENVGDLQLSG